MKNFVLNKVRYKNIMSSGQQMIEVDLSSHHKTLVTGINGAGKSTIIEAMTYGCFGKPFRDIKLGQLINMNNKKDCYVEVEGQSGNNQILIKRGQKPTIFEVTVNGSVIDQDASAADLQAKLEVMIGMSYKAFKQVVILGTAGYVPFMQLTKPERRKLVEDLLEVSVLAEMDKLNKVAIREINSNISVIDMKKDHLQTEIKTHQDYAEKQKKLSGDNVDRLRGMLQECVQQIEDIRDKNIAINAKIANIAIPDDPTSDTDEAQRYMMTLGNKFDSSRLVISLYNRGGSCHTCMQPLSNVDMLEDVKSKHADIEKAYLDAKEKWNSLCDVRKKFQDVQKQVNELKNEAANNKTLAVNIAEKAKKIKAAMAEAEKEFIDNTDAINALREQVESIIEEKSSLVMEKYRRGVITEMLKDSGIKGSIVKKYVPLFNKHINSYLEILGADYTFILDEEFSETITSRGREGFSYNSFSQGEKTRIDIALLFTWRTIASMVSGVDIKNLVMDEVFDSAVDADGIKAINSILNTMPNHNFFIISHNKNHNPQDYGQHIQMKKVGRFTVRD